MAVEREVIYLDKDNSIDLLLKSDGSAQDLSGVTHMEVVISGVTIHSKTSSTLFSGVTSSTGQLTLKLGSAGGLTSGSYQAELIVYDTSNSNGIVWGEIPILIKS